MKKAIVKLKCQLSYLIQYMNVRKNIIVSSKSLEKRVAVIAAAIDVNRKGVKRWIKLKVS